MHVNGTIDGDPLSYDYHAHTSRNAHSVAANLSYTYVRPTYVDFVVAIIRYRYYFQINITITQQEPTLGLKLL